VQSWYQGVAPVNDAVDDTQLDATPALVIPDRVPCAACGVPVDPVRAPQVAVIAERYQFYCSRECRERARPSPQRALSRARRRGAEKPGIAKTMAMLGIPLESLPPGVLDGTAEPRARETSPDHGDDRTRDEAPDPAVPAVALSAAVAAVLLATLWVIPLGARTVLLLIAALGALGAAATELWRTLRSAALFVNLAGFVGAMLPFADALRTSGERVPLSLREAAVLAAVAPVVGWVARARRATGRGAMERFRSALPGFARVPRKEAALAGVALAEETVEILDAARLRAGAEVLVEVGAVVPVDGVVRAGEAMVRLWPGAATPRRRAAGDAVLAGALVIEGTLRVLATRAGDEVSWARLARMMTTMATRPRVVNLARAIGQRAPFVLAVASVLAAVVHAVWTNGDGLLAAACALALAPCARAVSAVEAPFFSVLASAARRGIVFRDAESVEASARVGTVVLCLRGTVTRGRLELTEVVSLGERGEREIVATAAAVEEVAPSDPVARALSEAVARRGLRMKNIRRPVTVPGQGVTAVSAMGDPVLVGNRRLLLSEGISVAPAEDVASTIEGAGRTAVFVAINGRVEAVLGFEDTVRSEVRSSVQAMIDARYDVALLGGASRATMEAIGAMLDVANLRPEVLPEERASVVRALAEVGHGVAVVGRPARDGAALAAADVAVSIDAAGGAGTETAMALASDDLRDAAEALRLARRGRDRAIAALVVRAGGTALGAGVALAMPAWGLSVVAVTVVGVLVGEAVALRDEAQDEGA
jgi:cation transport ATPase